MAELGELHWLMSMVQSLDVGLVVLDRAYRIQVWNAFMENHSGLPATRVKGRPLYELFPNLPEGWLRRKCEPVFLLASRAFSSWEQRPYLFRFRTYRPITGAAEHMYQDVSFVPLLSPTGQVDHVGLLIYDVTDVAVHKQALEGANQQLEELNRVDGLTGLYNRRYLDECLDREFRRSRRSGQPASLLMMDVDHFKRINDTLGHLAGDEVLRATAEVLRKGLRATDLAGRYGGEEFCAILVDAPETAGLRVAERLREQVAGCELRVEGRSLRWTISVGVAGLAPELDGPRAWVARADQALYRAKELGRNRCCLFGA